MYTARLRALTGASRRGITQFGERWYIVSEEVVGRISGMIWAAVAPVRKYTLVEMSMLCLEIMLYHFQ